MCVSHKDLIAHLQTTSPEQAQQIEYNRAMIFGDIMTEKYYLHHYHKWRHSNGEAHDFKMHIYTDNKHHSINVLYHRLFCVLINYIGLLTQEEELFNIFKAYHYAMYVSSSFCDTLLH